MNRSLIAATLFASLMLSSSIALADESDNRTPAPPAPTVASTHMGVAPIVMLAVGARSDSAGPGLGAAIELERALGVSMSVTGRVAYLHCLDQTQTILAGTGAITTSQDLVPVFVGLKYYPANERGFYLAPELGIVYASSSASGTATVGGGSVNTAVSGSGTSVAAAASAGLALGRWDARAGMVALDLGHPDTGLAVMASLAYAFAL
jgi:hypothetical protein